MSSKTFTLTKNGKPVKPAKENPSPYSFGDFLSQCDIVKKEGGKLLTKTNPQNTVCPSFGNSFIGCLWDAYSNHHKLVLRPDDLWLTIVMALAGYVDYHAEEMRHHFVAHDGKKDLTIDLIGSTSTVDWNSVIEKFSDLIDENTTNGIRDWIEPNFSTTTSNDSLIARVALMGIAKHYFSYSLVLRCGIPQVELMGTLADWQNLRNRVDRFSQFNEQPFLIWWHDILIPIIDKFIDSYNGNVDNDFWQSCAVYLPGQSSPNHFSGWALAFSPFSFGKWCLNHPDDIALTGSYGKVETNQLELSSSIKVPLKIDDHGRVYDAYFYAGGFVSKYCDGYMSPNFDFALFEVTNVLKNTNSLSIDSTDPTIISNENLHNDSLHLHRCMLNFRCGKCNATCPAGIAYKSSNPDKLFCLKCAGKYVTLLVTK